MSAAAPGPLRRLGLRLFRALPARPSYALIRMAAPTFSMGAVAVIQHQERVLVLRQLHRTGWSLPGGLLDRGEDPAQAVTREVREETGLEIDPGDVRATVVSPQLRHVDVIFVVDCDELPQIHPASEATSADWFALEDIPSPDQPTRRILRAVQATRQVPRSGRVR
ncbi:NUDIX hydrolase [Dermacoccaceae bacterium W4C1]